MHSTAAIDSVGCQSIHCIWFVLIYMVFSLVSWNGQTTDGPLRGSEIITNIKSFNEKYQPWFNNKL